MSAEIIEKARKYLENVTPVKGDCGKLCGSLCCKNLYSDNSYNFDNSDNDGEAGMWLFPGEEELYKNNKNFTVIPANGNNSYPFILCELFGQTASAKNSGGFCARNERPLFCRLFPYFPLVRQVRRGGETEYRIKIIIHPAAVKMCPAINLKLKITSDFSRAVKKACYLILNQKDGELKKYLIETGEYLNHMTEFANRIYKNQ